MNVITDLLTKSGFRCGAFLGWALIVHFSAQSCVKNILCCKNTFFAEMIAIFLNLSLRFFLIVNISGYFLLAPESAAALLIEQKTGSSHVHHDWICAGPRLRLVKNAMADKFAADVQRGRDEVERLVDDASWLLNLRPSDVHMLKAKSKIKTRDWALQDDLSEQNGSWDDSGTIISETWVTHQSFMGSRMRDLPLIRRMDRTSHSFSQTVIKTNATFRQVLVRTMDSLKNIQRPK